MSLKIPKIIHQTWKTSEIPDQWKSSSEKYKEFVSTHPGWEYKLWTDEDNRNLIKNYYPWFLEQYDNYEHGIQRADAVRYFILHKYGGIYSDLDIQPKIDLNNDKFLKLYEMYENDDICLTQTKSSNLMAKQNYTNCFMMSKKECDFWPVVWERLKNPFKNKGWKKALAWSSHYFQVLFTTGPGIISDSVVDYENKYKNKKVSAIPANFTQPGQEKDVPPVSSKESAVELLRGESWQKHDATFWRGLQKVYNCRDWIFITMMLIFFILFLVFVILFVKMKNESKNFKNAFKNKENF